MILALSLVRGASAAHPAEKGSGTEWFIIYVFLSNFFYLWCEGEMERALGVIEMSQHQINWFDLFWIISDETVWGSAMHQLELDYIILSLGNIFNLMMIFPLLLFPGFNNKSVRSTLSPIPILHICIYSLRKGERDLKMDTKSKKGLVTLFLRVNVFKLH